MATIHIPDTTFRRLAEVAASLQLPLDKFLDRVATSNAGLIDTNSNTVKSGTPEWTKAFNDWVASHPARDFVADDSRDAIYGDERD